MALAGLDPLPTYIPPREDPSDALIAPRFRTLDALPDGATVGTGSLRRRAQLLHLRPGLKVVDVRGNVETRLNQALGGALDAVVLAGSGLHRLGLDAHVTERLGPPQFLPAPGQGALGVECRAVDTATLALLRPLDHPPTRRAVVRRLARSEPGAATSSPTGCSPSTPPCSTPTAGPARSPRRPARRTTLPASVGSSRRLCGDRGRTIC